MHLKARLAKLEQRYPVKTGDLESLTDREMDAQIARLYGLLSPAERIEADEMLAAAGLARITQPKKRVSAEPK